MTMFLMRVNRVINTKAWSVVTDFGLSGSKLALKSGFKIVCCKLTTQFDEVSSVGDYGEPSIPKTIDEYITQKSLKPIIQPKNPRMLRVAIIGAPNAGKSTLTNKLMGWRVCSVSSKVHTTRHNTCAVKTVGSTQIAFLDTPGLITPETAVRHKLEPSLVMDPVHSLRDADAVGIIVDAANKWTRDKLDPVLLNLLLKNQNKNVFLVLNKCDCVKTKSTLLSSTRSLTGGVIGNTEIGKPKKLPIDNLSEAELLQQLFRKTLKSLESTHKIEVKMAKGNLCYSGFSKVFYVSALTGEGVNDVLEYLINIAEPHPWLYHPTFITDQAPQEVAIMALRGQLLDHFKQEIPYNLQIQIEMWEVENPSLLRIAMVINCDHARLMTKIIGPKGETVQKLVELTKQELADTFRCDILLKIIVASEKPRN